MAPVPAVAPARGGPPARASHAPTANTVRVPRAARANAKATDAVKTPRAPAATAAKAAAVVRVDFPVVADAGSTRALAVGVEPTGPARASDR
jgi:hypothetical protein